MTSLNQSVWLKHTIPVINLLLLVWILWLITTAISSFISEPMTIQATNEDYEVSARAEVDHGIQLIAQLPSWHLFGEISNESMASESPVIPSDAPDTELNLVLHGVLDSDEGDLMARAIIADRQGNEQHYAVGDVLPGKAKLAGIYPDRIIMKRNGQYESLWLHPDDVHRSSREAVDARQQAPVTRATTIAKESSPTGQGRKDKPKSLSQLINIRRKKDAAGRDAGFLLYPGGDPGLFERAGLRPGDQVIRINGVATDSPAKLWRALQSSTSGQSVNLTVLRGGQSETFSFTIPD